jgi:integrase
MKKFPKPWYRASRATWYVTIRGQQQNLGPDKETAWELYKQLLVQSPEPAAHVHGQSVLGLIDKFLAWCREHRVNDTYEWYRWRLQQFAQAVPRTLTADQLRPFHIDEFLQKHEGWADGTKHGVARAVQRAMRWAEKQGYIAKSPIAHYEKAKPGRRTLVIAPDEFERLLALGGGQPFRDLLSATWETGCRPQESLIVEAKHVDLVNARWVIPPDDSKDERWPRIVYLTDIALEITRRLMHQNPAGPIFRNSDGNPWTPYAVNCAFIRLQIRLGLQRMKKQGITIEATPKPDEPASAARARASAEQRKERICKLRDRRKEVTRLAKQHGQKYCLYNFRHSWLDRALKRGVDALTCAILMGHRDPSTISKVYQHLSQSPDYLRGAAKKAAG